MANRRMFSKKIIDTDLFLDMPSTTQMLYFHLCMRADDDGFVGNPKRIMRMTGTSDDDLKLLIAKQFIIPFETGICVIRHWRLHNYIQKDRYQETFHEYEKSLLAINVNGEYTAMDTKCIQNVSEMDTQVRLEKEKGDTYVKNSLDDDVESSSNPCTGEPNYQQIVDIYHDLCPSLPRVRSISDKRKKSIKARLKDYDIPTLEETFKKAEASNFLTARDGRTSPFICNFDWLLNENNMLKVLEGNYENKPVKKPNKYLSPAHVPINPDPEKPPDSQLPTT